MYSFADDCQLEKVNLGDNLQTIGKNAFEGCGMLTYIPSKDSVKEIGDHAFKGCEIEDPASANYVNPEEDSAE